MDIIRLDLNDEYSSLKHLLNGTDTKVTKIMGVSHKLRDIASEVQFDLSKFHAGHIDIFVARFIRGFAKSFYAARVKNLCCQLDRMFAVWPRLTSHDQNSSFFAHSMPDLESLVIYKKVVPKALCGGSGGSGALDLENALSNPKEEMRDILMLVAAITGSHGALKKAVCTRESGYPLGEYHGDLLKTLTVKIMSTQRKHNKNTVCTMSIRMVMCAS